MRIIASQRISTPMWTDHPRSERSDALRHDWKSCNGQKPFEGSNPSFSAILSRLTWYNEAQSWDWVLLYSYVIDNAKIRVLIGNNEIVHGYCAFIRMMTCKNGFFCFSWSSPILGDFRDFCFPACFQWKIWPFLTPWGSKPIKGGQNLTPALIPSVKIGINLVFGDRNC